MIHLDVYFEHLNDQLYDHFYEAFVVRTPFHTPYVPELRGADYILDHQNLMGSGGTRDHEPTMGNVKIRSRTDTPGGQTSAHISDEILESQDTPARDNDDTNSPTDKTGAPPEQTSAAEAGQTDDELGHVSDADQTKHTILYQCEGS